jgi:hypothetical protein
VDNSLDFGWTRTDNRSQPGTTSAESQRGRYGPVRLENLKNDAEMAAHIRSLFEANDASGYARAQYEMAAEDVVNEYPQSGERFKGRDNIAAMYSSYTGSTGTTPTATLRRILKPGDAWVIESTIDYGDGTPVSSISIVETGPDGKIVRQTDYFANPFQAPAWRRQYAEPT